MNRPTFAVLSARPSRTSWMVARAAAQDSGFPPYVDPCVRVGDVEFVVGDHCTKRHAAGDALSRQQNVRLNAGLFDRPHGAGAAHA